MSVIDSDKPPLELRVLCVDKFLIDLLKDPEPSDYMVGLFKPSVKSTAYLR